MFVGLCGEGSALGFFLCELVLLGIELAFLGIQFVLTASKFGLKLVELCFLGPDVVFPVAKLIVFLIHLAVVLTLKLEKMLLRLYHLLLFRCLCFGHGLLKEDIRAVFAYQARNNYVNGKCENCARSSCQNVINHHILYNVTMCVFSKKDSTCVTQILPEKLR